MTLRNRFCYQCREPLREEASFCSGCGVQISGSAVESNQPRQRELTQQVESDRQTEQSKTTVPAEIGWWKKNWWMPILWGGTFLLVLSLVAAVASETIGSPGSTILGLLFGGGVVWYFVKRTRRHETQ